MIARKPQGDDWLSQLVNINTINTNWTGAGLTSRREARWQVSLSRNVTSWFCTGLPLMTADIHCDREENDEMTIRREGSLWENCVCTTTSQHQWHSQLTTVCSWCIKLGSVRTFDQLQTEMIGVNIILGNTKTEIITEIEKILCSLSIIFRQYLQLLIYWESREVREVEGGWRLSL